MVRGLALKFAFAIPGDLTLPTGGYAYARRILSLWPDQNIDARVISLPSSFPHPTVEDLAITEGLLEGPGPLLIDGLAFGAFPEPLAAQIGPRSVVLLHHPLCDEQGLSPEQADRLETNERAALSHAAGVVATSNATSRDLANRFNVPLAKMLVAEPGIDPAPKALLAGDPPRLLAVGTVTPRKGYEFLIDALKSLSGQPWHLDIHGALDRDALEAQRIRLKIEEAELTDRITLHGASSDAAIADAYVNADLFVAPSLHEGYGMAVVEAMAHGLPVVVTTAGALKDTAPCAAHCAPEDADDLARALSPYIESVQSRVDLGEACRQFAQSRPGWEVTAETVARAMRRLA